MSGNGALAGFFGTNSDNNPLVISVLMHVKTKIYGAAIDFNQPNPLLNNIILRSGPESGLKHSCKLLERSKSEKNIAAWLSEPGVITSLRQVGQTKNTLTETSCRRLIIYKLMSVQHFLDHFHAWIHMRLWYIDVDRLIILQQSIDIGFVKEAPVEERNVLPFKTIAKLIGRLGEVGSPARQSVIHDVRKRYVSSGESTAAIQEITIDSFISPIDIFRCKSECIRILITMCKQLFYKPCS